MAVSAPYHKQYARKPAAFVMVKLMAHHLETCLLLGDLKRSSTSEIYRYGDQEGLWSWVG